jgi:hypothetical protein
MVIIGLKYVQCHVVTIQEQQDLEVVYDIFAVSKLTLQRKSNNETVIWGWALMECCISKIPGSVERDKNSNRTVHICT